MEQSGNVFIWIRFALRWLLLTFGLQIGCRYRYRFNNASIEQNILIRNAKCFLMLAIFDLITLIACFQQQITILMITALIRSFLSGLTLIYLLLALFYFQIDSLKQVDTKRKIQLYFLMLFLGIFSIFILFLYYYSGLYRFNENIYQSLTASIFYCRIIFSLISSILMYLVWRAVHLSDNDLQLAISEIQSDNTLSLNCISLAAQLDPDECLCQDNFSIKTMSRWKSVCLTIYASLLFSLAFNIQFGHLIACTIWPSNFYSNSMTSSQSDDNCQ